LESRVLGKGWSAMPGPSAVTVYASTNEPPPQKILLIIFQVNDLNISDQTDKNRYYTWS